MNLYIFILYTKLVIIKRNEEHLSLHRIPPLYAPFMYAHKRHPRNTHTNTCTHTRTQHSHVHMQPRRHATLAHTHTHACMHTPVHHTTNTHSHAQVLNIHVHAHTSGPNRHIHNQVIPAHGLEPCRACVNLCLSDLLSM